MDKFLKKIFSSKEKSYKTEIVNTSLNPWSSSSNSVLSNWVYVCIDKIADVISKTEFKLMKINSKEESEELSQHAFLDRFYKPNNYQTLSDFLYIITSWLELKGNTYVLIGKEDMHVLNTNNVQAIYAQNMTDIVRYSYYTNQGEVIYSVDDVVHIKYPNPFNSRKGIGTAEKIKDWIDIDTLSLQFTEYMFKNGAILGGVIETDTNDKKKLKDIAQAFKERYTGVSKIGETPVLPKGVTYKPFTLSPKDMQVNESGSGNIDRIFKAFGISKTILGDVDGQGRANAEASQYAFMSQTIQPKVHRIVEYLNEFMIKRLYPNDSIYLDFVSPVPSDKLYKLEETKASLGGKAWKTVNEVRAEQGLPTVDNGDEINKTNSVFSLSLDKHKRLNNSVPYSATKNFYKKQKEDEKIDKLAEELTEKVLEGIHQKFITRVDKQEKKVTKMIINHDKALTKEILKNLRNQSKKLSAKDLFDVKKYIEELFILMSPILYKIAQDEGEENMKLLPTTVVFDSEEKKLKKTIKNVGILRGRKFAKTTQKMLLKEVREAWKNGEAFKEIEKRVNNVMDMTGEYRALGLAKDISFATANTSIEHAFIQSGVVTEKRWRTVENERVCPWCDSMNGTVISVGESFFKDGDILKVDDQEMSVSLDVQNPPLHPNCYCRVFAETISV